MVSATSFFAVFAILPLSLGTLVLPPSSDTSRIFNTRRSLVTSGERWLPRANARIGRRNERERPVVVRGAGIDLPMHQAVTSIPRKRSLDNGSTIELATAHK